MIDFDTLRKDIVSGLSRAVHIPFIRSNQTGEPPAYPYGSYTITSLVVDQNGTWGEYEDGKHRKPFTQVWSITIQSDKAGQSMELCMRAREWLDHAGQIYLNDRHIIVQKVGAINNRDNLVTIEYEYRNGFDCVFWLMSETDNLSEETGTIETVVYDE